MARYTAFSKFVVSKYGTEAFLRVYFACRPGRFEAECHAQLWVDIEIWESAFMAEAERSVGNRHSQVKNSQAKARPMLTVLPLGVSINSNALLLADQTQPRPENAMKWDGGCVPTRRSDKLPTLKVGQCALDGASREASGRRD
jgi:hypothetical protein